MNKKVFLILVKQSFLKLCAGIFLSLMLCHLVACSNGNSDKKNANQLAGPGRSQGAEQNWASIELPKLSQQTIKLRVANVINSRFKQLSSDQLEQILKRTQQLVKQSFNIDIIFADIKTLAIEDVFKSLNQHVVAERSSEIVNINFIDQQAREDMQQSLYKTLSNYKGDRQNVIDFAQPYLLQPDIKQQNFIELSYALVDTLISRLDYWKTQQADDGGPVLEHNGYHEWVWWDSLGYGDFPYEVVITNQLVASAEYYGMDVHSSLRGGLTAGTTTYNKNTLFSTYVYIMVYPMLNDTELLTTLRQDETYDSEQIINYSAALLTHELGHMLLHLGHPFANSHCIMSPTRMLNYREWYDSLDVTRCAIGSSQAMTPGAAKIDYNRSW